MIKSLLHLTTAFLLLQLPHAAVSSAAAPNAVINPQNLQATAPGFLILDSSGSQFDPEFGEPFWVIGNGNLLGIKSDDGRYYVINMQSTPISTEIVLVAEGKVGEKVVRSIKRATANFGNNPNPNPPTPGPGPSPPPGPGPTPPPNPGPTPNPSIPDGRYKLGLAAYTEAIKLPTASKTKVKDVAAIFLDVGNKLKAGKYQSKDEAGAESFSKIDALVGSDAAWTLWRTSVGSVVAQYEKDDKMPSTSDFGDAFLEIQTGLNAVPATTALTRSIK